MNLYRLATEGIDLDALPLEESQQPRASFQFESSARTPDRLRLPGELDDVFNFAAQEYGVDVDVLRGIAYAESRFNPDIISGKVKSPVGAIGLMQFMPETAKEYGIDPTDPVQSIIGGAAYLRNSLDKFGGDYERAVASYNWGPNRKAYDYEDWASKAPAETQKYLMTVFDAAGRFKDGAAERSLPAGVEPSKAGAGRGVVSPGMVNTKELTQRPQDALPIADTGALGSTASAINTGLAKGVAKTSAGLGTFLQDPGGSIVSGLTGAGALLDRGVSSALSAVGIPTVPNEQVQRNAQIAAESAQQRRGERYEDGNPLAIAGRFMEDDSRRVVRELQNQERQQNPRLVAQQKAMYEAEGFVGNLKAAVQNPIALTNTLAESAFPMAAGVGAASLATRMGGVGAVSATGTASEAGFAAMNARESVYQTVADMPVEKLAKSPRFQEILQSVKDPVAARELLANELADQAPLLTAAGTAGGTLLTNRLFGGDATAKSIVGAGRMTGKEFASRVAQDTVEEVVQGVPEDLVQYGTLKQADTERKLDLAGSAAQNMVGGFAFGVGGHGLAYGRDAVMAPRVESQPTTPQAPTVTPQAPVTPDAAKTQAVDNIAAAILEQEGGATQTAPVQPGQQTADAGAAPVDAAQQGAATGQAGTGATDVAGKPESAQSLTQPTNFSATPTATVGTQTSVQAGPGFTGQGIAAEMAALKARSQPQQATQQTELDVTGRPHASWVVKEKATGKVILETFDKAKVDALNTAKYEAVPIGRHLASLSQPQQAQPAQQQQAKPRAKPQPLLTKAEAAMLGDFERMYQADVKGEIKTRLGLMPARQEETQTPAEKRKPSELLAAIKRAGGIKSTNAGDLMGGNAAEANRILPGLFTKGGMNMDLLVPFLKERGYLTQADEDSILDNGGVNKLAEILQAELSGDRAQTVDSTAGFEADADKAMRADLDSKAFALGLPQKVTGEMSTERLSSVINRIERRLGKPVNTDFATRKMSRTEAMEERQAILMADRVERARAQYDADIQAFAESDDRIQDAALDVFTDENGDVVIVNERDADAELAARTLNGSWSDQNGQETATTQDSRTGTDTREDRTPAARGSDQGTQADQRNGTEAGAGSQKAGVVRTYKTRSGEIGAAVKRNISQSGAATYGYIGKWGAGSGHSAEYMAEIEADWKSSKKGFTVESGPADSAPETEALTTYTPAEVTARQDAAKEAEAATKRAEDAAARAEAAAKQASEIAQRSVAAADTFELGGNAEDNLSGQQGLKFSRKADIQAARAALEKIMRDGVTSPDDLRALLRVPGYSKWAKSTIAGDVESATALRGELQQAFPGSDWKAPTLNGQGIISIYSDWPGLTSQNLDKLTRIADEYDAPIGVRGGAATKQLVNRLDGFGFELYSGLQERADRMPNVMFGMIRPAGGITATTPLFSKSSTAPSTTASTIRQAITKAYGNLLDKLEGKGLVTIAQTEREAIEAAAQARANKTGGDVEKIKRSMLASVQMQRGGRMYVDPDTLIFREGDQNRTEGVSSAYANTEDMPAIVVIIGKDGEKTILDGHNRASVALSRGDNLAAVSLTQNQYDELQNNGYDDIEIAYATLRENNENDAADDLESQFPGAGVAERGKQAWINFPDPDSESAVDVKYSANGNIEGFFDRQTGKSFLVADNLTAASAPGTLMHEVGIHMAADGKLEPLFKRAGSLLKMGKGNAFIDRVQNRLDEAGETSAEEAAAYIVTEYEKDRTNAPASVTQWIKDFIADVRAWLFSKGVLLKADSLTVADIAAVARANARIIADGKGWTGYAQKDGAFRFGNTEGQRSKDIATVAEAFSSDRIKLVGVELDGGSYQVYLDGAPDQSMTVYPTAGGKWRINAQDANRGIDRTGDNAGQRMYQALFAWAHNNGHTVDAEFSLSYPNELRRTAAMLSSALRFGSTEHLGEPDEMQGINGWKEGGFASDVQALADAELRKVQERILALGDFTIEPNTGVVYVDQSSSGMAAILLQRDQSSSVDTGLALQQQGGVSGENSRGNAVGMGGYGNEERQGNTRRDNWSSQSDVVGRTGNSQSVSVPLAAYEKSPVSDSELARYLASTRGGFESHGVGVSTLKRALITRDHGGSSDLPGLLYSVDGKGDIRRSVAPKQPVQQTPAVTTWDDLGASKMDALIFEGQDDRIDLKRVQENIVKAGRQIREEFDARMAETLFPGRVAKRNESFVDQEVKPLLQAMAASNVSMEELGDYLLARHAPERNAQIAKVNPGMPDGGAGTNSQGVLMTTQAANDYIVNLSAGKRTALQLLAKRVDAITSGTRDILVTEGLEKASTVAAWEGAYKNYVPLFKDEAAETPGHPVGSGFSVKGGASKRAMGSTKEVTNVLAHVLMQREAAITRAEKNRVGMSLYGLALSNPNKEFWGTVVPKMSTPEIMAELQNMGVNVADAFAGMEATPTIRYVDPNTGLVTERPNPVYKNLDNALVVKVNGEDRVILFNKKNDRAMRLAESLKNQNRGWGSAAPALDAVGKVTRFMASMLTQYNPAFGMVNAVRDVQGALVNLSSTPIKGQQAKVLAAVPAAMKGIARDLRGDKARTQWSDLWVQFQDDGGRTGIRDLISDPYEKAGQVEKDLMLLSKSGKLTPGNAAHAVLNLLSDFNDTLENGVRLAAYKTAIDQGMSRPAAAKLARELTVDFNRKGRTGRELGKLYAFLNASIQGSARTIQTLKGPMGAKIMAGGFALGVLQAFMLAAAGFDDDDIPEFIKSRNLIIPMGGDRYVTIPMALGLHVLPNTGRAVTELVMSGGKDIGEKSLNTIVEIVTAFNPFGGGGDWKTAHGPLTMITPTVMDPVIDLAMNRDFTGRQISKERFGKNNMDPGAKLARESTKQSPSGQVYIGISEAINTAIGGTDVTKGAVSPTPEQLRYLATVVGGSVYRETERAINAAVLLARGEEVKPHQVPLGSRFAGVLDDEMSTMSRYYKNNDQLGKFWDEFKKEASAGNTSRVEEMKRDPRFAAAAMNNKIYRAIADVSSLASENTANKEKYEALNKKRAELMKKVNEAVKEAEKQ